MSSGDARSSSSPAAGSAATHAEGAPRSRVAPRGSRGLAPGEPPEPTGGPRLSGEKRDGHGSAGIPPPGSGGRTHPTRGTRGGPRSDAKASARAGARPSTQDAGGPVVRRSLGASSRHASITELELRFARNPESDAYRELAEAYVEAGRFMEAMVVSKKGIKAHPESVDAKVLLAEVYARQKKFPRALRELDSLAEDHPDSATVFVARGRTRARAGEESGAVEDLKRALDLDPEQGEATALLADRGIRYPEVKPPPVPDSPEASLAPPDAPAWGASGALPATLDAQTLEPPYPPSAGFGSMVPAGPSASGAFSPASSTVPPPTLPPTTVPPATVPPGTLPPATLPPPGHPADAPYRMAPQRLEGEEELERMARKFAEEKPPPGKPRTTLLLAVALFVVTAGVGAERLFHKWKVEAIDGLTVQAIALFNRDVYGSYQEAAKHLEEVLERHDAEHGPSLSRLAHTYAILIGEHGEANRQHDLTQILARAEELAPDAAHTRAARTLALLYRGTDRDTAARAAVDHAESFVTRIEATQRPPGYADLALGIAEMHLGEYERATRRLQVVKEVLHDSVRAKVAHGRAAFRARRLSAARAGFEAALRSEPDHPGARAGLALAKLRRGNLNGAAADLLKFDEVALARPKDISRRDAALAEFARSEVLRAAGDEVKATGAYEQAVRLDPDNPEFAFGLGRWLLKNYRVKEALGPLRRAVQQDPNRWSFLVELAEAEMRAGNWTQAQRRIKEANARAPDVVDVQLAKARLLRRTKKPAAEAYIRDLMEKHPSRAREINLELGRYYRGQGQLEQAQEAFEKAIEAMDRAPRLEQAEALLSYGKLMDDMERHQWALNSYKKAADLGAIEGWYRASKALKRAGQRAQAKKACERYLRAGASLRYSQSAKRLCDSL